MSRQSQNLVQRPTTQDAKSIRYPGKCNKNLPREAALDNRSYWLSKLLWLKKLTLKCLEEAESTVLICAPHSKLTIGKGRPAHAVDWASAPNEMFRCPTRLTVYPRPYREISTFACDRKVCTLAFWALLHRCYWMPMNMSQRGYRFCFDVIV